MISIGFSIVQSLVLLHIMIRDSEKLLEFPFMNNCF